jgi:signal transduction histidine kinase
VKKIAEEHGGSVSGANVSASGGAIFTVRLPLDG